MVLHLATQLSASWFEAVPGISLWYPPAGLALSLLILLGPRYWGVVLGANIGGALLGTSLPTWWAPLLFPALITANYAAIAWLVRRALGPQLLPGTSRGTFLFSLVVAGAPLGIALSGTAVLLPLQLVSTEGFGSSVLLWWVGDVSGLITVMPVAMTFVGPWLHASTDEPGSKPQWTRLRSWTVLLQAAALLGCLWLIFTVAPQPRHNSLYLCFLPLVWIALTQGLPGATLATLIITMGSLVGIQQTGPSQDGALSFLLFELTVAIVGLGLGSAVTRRNSAEQKLAANEARLDRVIAGAQLGVWDWNIADQTLMSDSRCAELAGCSPQELQPSMEGWQRLIHPADLPHVKRQLEDHLQGRSSLYEAEYRIRAKDQHWRWIYSRGSLVEQDAAGEPLIVSGTHLDITARKHAEAEAHRLLQILETTSDFVVTTDLGQSILHTNRSVLKLLGRSSASELRGRPLREVFPEEALRKLENEILPTALSAGICEGELVLRNAQQWQVPVSLVTLVYRDESSNSVTVSFVMRDISRQKEMEAENIQNERRILQVQKSESIGVLAGGIAHDFNNLLTAMLGYANLSRLELPAESPIHTWLGQIEVAALRAAELCRQMLAYAGRSPMSFADIDVSELVRGTTHLLHVSIGKKIRLELQLASHLPCIRAAASEMQQVLMNLVLNASEAIGEQEGAITIRTCQQTLDTHELSTQFDASSMPAGSYVLIEVEDTGCGIPSDSIHRIFEPFFTTKFTGHGLGLAAVLGIVKSHRGVIHVLSQVGSGSSFRMLFPATNVSAPPVPDTKPGTTRLSGTGTILVVDDEPSVRGIVGSLLVRFGFQPLLAVDGVEGVELFRRHSADLRCVLLDLTMPRMDGEQAFSEMNRIRSDIPILLMSGFTDRLTSQRFTGKKPAAFLAKPFEPAALESLLGSVLQSQGGGSPCSDDAGRS